MRINLLIILGTILLCSSCKKEPVIIDLPSGTDENFNFIQASVNGGITINLDSIGQTTGGDITIVWSSTGGLAFQGSSGKSEIKFNANSNWSIRTQTDYDTTYVDTVMRNNIPTLDFSNKENIGDIYNIDTTTFAKLLMKSAINNVSGTINTSDTVLISSGTNGYMSMSGMPYQHIGAYFSYGSDKYEHEYWIVFEHSTGTEKALRFEMKSFQNEATYYLMEVVEL